MAQIDTEKSVKSASSVVRKEFVFSSGKPSYSSYSNITKE